MNEIELGDTTEEKDLGVIVADDLMTAKHCGYAYSKGNRILGMIKRTIISRDIHILLNLYKTHSSSTLGVWFSGMVSSLPER